MTKAVADLVNEALTLPPRRQLEFLYELMYRMSVESFVLSDEEQLTTEKKADLNRLADLLE